MPTCSQNLLGFQVIEINMTVTKIFNTSTEKLATSAGYSALFGNIFSYLIICYVFGYSSRYMDSLTCKHALNLKAHTQTVII